MNGQLQKVSISMLINKCKLFSAGANLTLARMYLEQLPEIRRQALIDNDADVNAKSDTWGSSSKDHVWWDELLSKKVTPEALALLTEMAMKKRSPHTAGFILERLAEDDKAKMYKWALGLKDDQEISMTNLLAKVGFVSSEHNRHQVYEATYRAMREDYFTLKDLNQSLPVPPSIQDDLHQLIWQVRHIFRNLSPNGSGRMRVPEDLMEREFITGGLDAMLWREGSEAIVTMLDEEYRTSPPLSHSGSVSVHFNEGYRDRILLALQNERLSHAMKAKYFDALLNDAYGQMGQSSLVPLMQSHLLPDEYIHQMVAYLCSQSEELDEHGKLSISSDHKAKFIAFFSDPRLTDKERKKLIRLNTALMHDHLEQPNFTYKHARDLAPEDIARELSQSSKGYVAPGSVSSDYGDLREALNGEITLALEDLLLESEQELTALSKNGCLNDEHMRQLINIFMAIDKPTLMDVFNKNGNLPLDLLSDVEDYVYQRAAIDENPINNQYDVFLRKICQLYLSQQQFPDELLRKFVRRHINRYLLGAEKSDDWQVNSASIPVSLNSVMAAIDYQPGYAFELIKCHIPLRYDMKSNNSKIEVLVKLAMTREIYPAIIEGQPLDVKTVSEFLKGAAKYCKFDEFDIRVLSKLQDTGQFIELAGELLKDPTFMQKHKQAYELLVAEVLKRKTEASVAPAMATSKQRLAI